MLRAGLLSRSDASEAEAHQDHAGEDAEEAEELKPQQRCRAPNRGGGFAGLDRRRQPLPRGQHDPVRPGQHAKGKY